MESNLRPLTLGEILDRTAHLYRTNFPLLAGIFSVYAAVWLVFGFIQLALDQYLRARHLYPGLRWIPIAVGIVETVLALLLLGAAIAAISRAVASVHLGEPITIRGAYAGIRPRLGRYLWLMTITFVIAWLPAMLLYGALIAVFLHYRTGLTPAGTLPNPAQQQALMYLGIAGLVFFILMIPVAVYTTWMSLRYSFSVPACVVEDLTARVAIRRSVELSKGARARVFVLFLLVGIIKYGLAGLTQFFVFISAFKNHGQLAPGVQAISQVIAFFTNTFVGPIGATGLTLFYYDQRVRKEGYDIEWMMAAAGLTVPHAATASLASDAEKADVEAGAAPVGLGDTTPEASAPAEHA